MSDPPISSEGFMRDSAPLSVRETLSVIPPSKPSPALPLSLRRGGWGVRLCVGG